MSIADNEIEEPDGAPAHIEGDACRCADCVSEQIDYWADMEVDE